MQEQRSTMRSTRQGGQGDDAFGAIRPRHCALIGVPVYVATVAEGS